MKLSNFLKQEGAYYRFLNNFDRNLVEHTTVRIDNNFVWDKSSEGRLYWGIVWHKWYSIRDKEYDMDHLLGKPFTKGTIVTFVDSLEDIKKDARLYWNSTYDMDYLFGRKILLTEDFSDGTCIQLKRRKDKIYIFADTWDIHRPFFKEYYNQK